jgi:D-alanyl-D-alanine carboxypeptidase (penicillin-binding protein 5/6)
LPLGLDDPLYVTVPRGRYEDLEASMIVTPVIEAPVARGTQLGNVNLELDDEIVVEAPLVALTDVNKGGLMSRMTDHAILLFNSLFE